MSKTNARRAFTLIELLVVIAIISILAAILFPVFASARENARAIAATSQAREIGIAVRMYVEDYDETFPIFQAYNTLDYSGNPAPPWASNHLGVETELLPYIKNHDIFKDPDDVGSPFLSTGYPASVKTDSYYDAYGSSYRYDQAGFSYIATSRGSYQDDTPPAAGSVTRLVFDSTYAFPANTRIMRDEEFPWFGPSVDPTGSLYGYYTGTPSTDYYQQWHPRGGVVIFADGHAKFVVSQGVWDAIGVDPATGGSYNDIVPGSNPSTNYYWGYD
jgi:prepilin-type N-terminal cleavage/methylation domain-containing protein